MSAEELVTQVWTRWNSGERDLDPDLFTEDVEVHSALTKTVYVGQEGVRAWTAEIGDQFERWELDIDNVEAFGADLVVVSGRIKLTGRESGVALDQPASWLLTLRDGRIAVVRNYIGKDAAREAAATAERKPG